MELSKVYDPKEVEDKIYHLWEKGKFFKPEANPKGEPYCIIMPPPNANAPLHIGHAVFVTIEDLMIRYARMQGKTVLWLPGADHAGFETQVVFERKLEKEGPNRFQIPRDELYKMMWDFTQKNKKIMEGQLKKLGASCDFEREKFTLDPDIIQIVYQTFKKLYDDGLAYRALRLVNWCPKHQTSLSDLEVKYEEQQDPLYFLKYGPIVIATTRPETMFADAAIAVNPKDKRYKNLIGKKIHLPLTEREIPIIADETVDIEFGTGAVKITPAHDPMDFEVGQRHNLELFSIIDEKGRFVSVPQAQIKPEIAEKLTGKKAMEARQLVAEEVKKLGLMEKIDEKYIHSVGVCYKCGNTIEPMPKEQWFIATKSLAKEALEAVKNGRVSFITKRFEKIFNHWMNNIRDWNISRQIVWGIRIPAWYRGEEIYVGLKPPKGKGWEQDPDVFDTWFSSGQWPVAALKAQKNPKDFEKFYPTTIMETGWDILFFWVARMIMLGLYCTGEVPFKKIYLHGLVRDKDRQKMSKSKGNVIDPLGVAEEYGTDAVRMALVFGTGTGNDIIISEDKIRGMRNFANKVWNISRFVLMQTANLKPQLKTKKITEKDKWIFNELNKTIKEATGHLDNFRFSQAAELIYEFIWHKFADAYVEASKEQLKDEKLKENTQVILLYVLSTILKLLHPFMPFISEEIWQKLPGKKDPLIISSWPK